MRKGKTLSFGHFENAQFIKANDSQSFLTDKQLLGRKIEIVET